MNIRRIILVAAASVLAVAIHLLLLSSVHAGSISRGGSSFSAARAAPAPARSLGMQRPSYTPSAAPRTNTYVAPPAPVTSTTVVTGGGGFGSTFLGSMAGTVVGNAISHPSTTVVAGGAPVVAAPGVTAAPVVVQQSSGFGQAVLNFFAVVLMIIAALLVAFFAAGAWAWGRAKLREARNDEQNGGLPFSPVGKFLQIQRAFATKDTDRLRDLLGPDLLEQVLDDLPDQAQAGHTMKDVSYDVTRHEDSLISIVYRATDTSDGSKVNETWHFVPFHDGWLLNGIQQR